MEKTNMEKRMEQLLRDEKEKLLSEVRDAILKKKSMIVDDDKIYYKRRRF